MKNTTNTNSAATTPVFDLRNFPKEIREVIKSKRKEAEDTFLTNVRQLLSQDSISQQQFLSVFEANKDFIFLDSNSKDRVITFKQDGTPDLRSLPVKVRNLFKALQIEATNKKKVFTNEVLSKQTITEEDLNALKELGKINLIKQKFNSVA